MIVYKVICPDGKYYIGSTGNLIKRITEHKSFSLSNNKRQKVSLHLSKFNFEDIKFIELAKFQTRKEAYNHERELINKNKFDKFILNEETRPDSWHKAKSENGKKRMTSDVAKKMNKKLWSNSESRLNLIKKAKARSTSEKMRQMAYCAMEKWPDIIARCAKTNKIIAVDKTATGLAKKLDISEFSVYRYLAKKRISKKYIFERAK